MDDLINKSYDYITSVLTNQKKPLSFKTLYGDGTIFNNNKILFKAVYNEILNQLNWEAKDDLK